eukprot:1390049-Rhodomonas_salina.2
MRQSRELVENAGPKSGPADHGLSGRDAHGRHNDHQRRLQLSGGHKCCRPALVVRRSARPHPLGAELTVSSESKTTVPALSCCALELTKFLLQAQANGVLPCGVAPDQRLKETLSLLPQDRHRAQNH